MTLPPLERSVRPFDRARSGIDCAVVLPQTLQTLGLCSNATFVVWIEKLALTRPVQGLIEVIGSIVALTVAPDANLSCKAMCD